MDDLLISDLAEKLKPFIANPNLSAYQIGRLIELQCLLETRRDLKIQIAIALKEQNHDLVSSLISLDTNVIIEISNISTGLAMSK